MTKYCVVDIRVSRSSVITGETEYDTYLKLNFGLPLRTDFLTSDVRVLVDDREGVLLLGLHHPAESLGHEVQRPVGLLVPHVRHRQKDLLRRAAHGGRRGTRVGMRGSGFYAIACFISVVVRIYVGKMGES